MLLDVLVVGNRHDTLHHGGFLASHHDGKGILHLVHADFDLYIFVLFRGIINVEATRNG
jgi:hypothetical protein